MGELINKAKGRIKQAAGSLVGDGELKREGERDETKGKIEGVVEDVKDAAKEVVNDTRDAFKKIVKK